MIELSFGKLLLIAVVALLVLGPEKLPGAARTAGALLRRVRSGWDNVRSEVERELEIEEIRRSAREAAERAAGMKKQWDQSVRSVADGAGALDQQVQNSIHPPAAPATPSVLDQPRVNPVAAAAPLVMAVDPAPAPELAEAVSHHEAGAEPVAGDSRDRA